MHGVASMIIMSLEIYNAVEIPVWMKVISISGAILWLISIQIGLHLNIRSLNISLISKIWEHFKILFVSPFGALIETGIAFFVLTKWVLGYKSTRWVVTEK